MIDRTHTLSIVRQAKLLNISRGAVYYLPTPVSPEDLVIMNAMDCLHLDYPFMGSRQLRNQLVKQGLEVGRQHVRTLMRKMNIHAIAPQPGTSKRNPKHKVFPYLLRKLPIVRSNQVWALDTTYIRMAQGFVYLTAVVDVYSRRRLAHRTATTLEAVHAVEALQEAFDRFSTPNKPALKPIRLYETRGGSEQQIFDFLPGVGPERVIAIRETLQPLEVDLGTQNHRSPNSEILSFSNDILMGKVRGTGYKGVSSLTYRPEKPPPNWNHLLRRALLDLYNAVEAQTGAFPETVAILVANNRSALKMSNALNALGSYVGKPVRHKLLFDEAESLLSARFAAFLLEPRDLADIENDVATCMEMIASARRATGQARTEVAKLQAQALKIRGGKALNINIANALRSLIAELAHRNFTGDPAEDWLTVKHALRATQQAELLRVASQLDFLVAFRRGHHISAGLASEWLRDGVYTNARVALDQALAQEQILDGVEAPVGVQVMNIHKAKGKQFDGVIIVREARRTDRGVDSSFIWRDDDPPFPKSRRVLRVGITRARVHTLVLDPMWPSCPILKGHKF